MLIRFITGSSNKVMYYQTFSQERVKTLVKNCIFNLFIYSYRSNLSCGYNLL